MGTAGMAGSRLGFRGTEDLGGGLRANFLLEMGFEPDTGKGVGSSYGDGGANRLFFNRSSWVSLSNQWGELRLGRDYTATFWNWNVFDPFGTNGVGASTNLALSGAVQAALAPNASYGTLVRANNMVEYILPGGVQGKGLYGQLQIAAGENSNGNKYYGGRIGYAAGPFDIAAAYGKTDELQAGTDADADVWNIAGSWNFGFMKLSAFYGQISIDNLRSVNPLFGNDSAERENWFVGVTAPFGQWNLKASYGGTNGKKLLDNDDASQWAVGVDYNLSKRTALYATYGGISNDNNAQFSVNPTGSSPLSPGHNSHGGQLGIRHSF
jgi:predicted porin